MTEIRMTRFRMVLRSMSASLLLSIFGCQPATPAPVVNTAQPLPEYHGTADKALDLDECSSRMQDIGGVLAKWCYDHHGQLPDTLEQLKQMPGLGAMVNLTCPVTGQPYVYNPAGLYLANEPYRVVMWEPTASHGGTRLCMLVPKADPGKSVVTYVKPIPEKDFEKALPAIQ